MKNSSFRVGFSNFATSQGDIDNNLALVKSAIDRAAEADCRMLICNRMSLTGNNIGAMASSSTVISGAFAALCEVAEYSTSLDLEIIVSIPTKRGEQIYSISGGQLSQLGSRYGFVRQSIYIEVVCAHYYVDTYSNLTAYCLAKSRSSAFPVLLLSGNGSESSSFNLYCDALIEANNGEIVTSIEGLRGFACVEVARNSAEIVNCERSKGLSLFNNNTIYTGATISYHERFPFAANTAAEFGRAYDIMTKGIMNRLKEVGSDKVIFGLSGGLDSAMTLLTAAFMCDLYNLPRSNIIAVTMRGLGSSSRTQNNSRVLTELLGVTNIDISIEKAVRAHLADIQHDGSTDIVYENSQARERAQILLDLANKHNALVLGTSDLSEIALGWSTYGGDQLAQYNPNCSLTKTFIRAAITLAATGAGIGLPIVADDTKALMLREVLLDIVSTPISPELIPDQITEDTVGSYELIDYLLMHTFILGKSVSYVYRRAQTTFPELPKAEIKKVYGNFIKRFFRNQFKRLFCCDGAIIHRYSLANCAIKSNFNPAIFLSELADCD